MTIKKLFFALPLVFAAPVFAIGNGIPQLPDHRARGQVPANLLKCPSEGLGYEIEKYTIIVSEGDKNFARRVVTVLDILNEGTDTWNSRYSHVRPSPGASAKENFVPYRFINARFDSEKFAKKVEYVAALRDQAERFIQRIKDNNPPAGLVSMIDPKSRTPENIRAKMQSIVDQSIAQAKQLESALRDKNTVLGELLAVPGVRVECWDPWRSGVTLSN